MSGYEQTKLLRRITADEREALFEQQERGLAKAREDFDRPSDPALQAKIEEAEAQIERLKRLEYETADLPNNRHGRRAASARIRRTQR